MAYYGNPKEFKSGVIISSLSRFGVFNKSQFGCGDLLCRVNGLCLDSAGCGWDGELGVSLRLEDLFSRLDYGSSVLCEGVSESGELFARRVSYSVGVEPFLRVLDRAVDSVEMGELLNVRGVMLKVLRLDDVCHYGLSVYDGRDDVYRLMVCNVLVGSSGYKSGSVRPGSVLRLLNGVGYGKNFAESAALIGEALRGKFVKLEMEDGHILIV